MQITEVKILLRDEPKLKAFASITLDECIVVHGLKIILGQNGMFVAMPCHKRKDGEFQDIAHPINADTRKWLEKTILEAYEKALADPDHPHDGRDTGSMADRSVRPMPDGEPPEKSRVSGDPA